MYKIQIEKKIFIFQMRKKNHFSLSQLIGFRKKKFQINVCIYSYQKKKKKEKQNKILQS